MVIVGREGFASLRPILACLAEQTLANKIEVVVVLPRLEGDPPQQAAAAFAALRLVAAG